MIAYNGPAYMANMDTKIFTVNASNKQSLRFYCNECHTHTGTHHRSVWAFLL